MSSRSSDGVWSAGRMSVKSGLACGPVYRAGAGIIGCVVAAPGERERRVNGDQVPRPLRSNCHLRSP